MRRQAHRAGRLDERANAIDGLARLVLVRRHAVDPALHEQIETVGGVAGDEDRRVAVDHHRDVARRVARGRDGADAVGQYRGRGEGAGRVGRELSASMRSPGGQ